MVEIIVKLGDVLNGLGVDMVEELLLIDVLVGNLFGVLGEVVDLFVGVGGVFD